MGGSERNTRMMPAIPPRRNSAQAGCRVLDSLRTTNTRAPERAAPDSVGWRDADAHAQSVARVITQARDVDIAVVAVFHVVADDLALLADRAHRAALGLRGFVRATPGCAIAYRATGDRTQDGRRLASVALPNGVAEHAAHHRAQHRAGRGVAAFLVYHGLVVAFLPGHFGAGDALHGIRTQYVGPAVVGVLVVRGRRGVASILGKGAGGHHGEHEGGKPESGHDDLHLQSRAWLRIPSIAANSR